MFFLFLLLSDEKQNPTGNFIDFVCLHELQWILVFLLLLNLNPRRRKINKNEILEKLIQKHTFFDAETTKIKLVFP